MGQRRLAIGTVVLEWGCSPWRLSARRSWHRWPRHRRRREPRRSTGPGRWLTGFSAVQEVARTALPTCTSWRGTTSTATSRPAGLNIYGQFAGGAAWLAKAVQDKQALYGDKQISVIAGDNIGASPLVDGLFFGEPSTIVTNLMNADFASVGNHEFDKGYDRAAPHPERRLPSRRRLHRGALRPGQRRHHQHATPAPTSSTCRPTSCATTTARRCSRRSAPSGSRATAARSSTIGIIGEVLEATPTIVTPTGVAGLTFQDEADAANVAVSSSEEGREHERARDPPGRLPVGHGDA